jgi:DNA-binding response OmpR family regulator
MLNSQVSLTPPRRILLVDDFAEIRDLLATMLRRDGFEVDTTEDGASGWDAFCSKKYDLLITDNDMPIMSGLDLVQRVRAIPDPLPVVVISGFTRPDDVDVVALLQPGAFIAKPFSFPVLRAKIAELMNVGLGGSNPGIHAADPVLPLQPEHGLHRDKTAAVSLDAKTPPPAKEQGRAGH